MAVEVKQSRQRRERGMFSALICILPVLLMHTADAHPMWQQSNKREETQQAQALQVNTVHLMGLYLASH